MGAVISPTTEPMLVMGKALFSYALLVVADAVTAVATAA
jgi:hypothetical protein